MARIEYCIVRQRKQWLEKHKDNNQVHSCNMAGELENLVFVVLPSQIISFSFV